MTLQRRVSATLALSTLVVLLALPAGARADHGKSFLHDDLATYMDIAHRQWGGPIPSCVENGVNVIPAHVVLYDDPDPEVAARAEQPGCRIWLDRSNWRTLRPVEVCTTIVHEWGHLLGFGHSADPFDVMAAFQLRPAQGCRRFTRPAHAAASSRAARRCKPRHARRSGRVARSRVRRYACVRHRA